MWPSSPQEESWFKEMRQELKRWSRGVYGSSSRDAEACACLALPEETGGANI